MIPVLLAFAAVQAAPAAAPAEAEETARFAACSSLARSAPGEAVSVANAWLIEGGGLFARQCLGLAYVGLERWAPAATVYGQAARDAGGHPWAPDLWVQAGNAWLAADEATQALEAFDAALATGRLSDGMRGEVHLDRARALVALGSEEAARAEVDRGLQLVPDDPFGWYLSAALARRQDDLARAGSDIARAVALAPDDPDVLLLAGTLAGLAGNAAEAERRYRQVASAAPASPAGRAAAASLAAVTETETAARPGEAAHTPPAGGGSVPGGQPEGDER